MQLVTSTVHKVFVTTGSTVWVMHASHCTYNQCCTDLSVPPELHRHLTFIPALNYGGRFVDKIAFESLDIVLGEAVG